MATFLILLSKLHSLMMTTSTVYAQEAIGKHLKGTQHVPSHSFMKVLVSHQHVVSSREFFHYHIVPLDAALRFHWSFSSSEATPRI